MRMKFWYNALNLTFYTCTKFNQNQFESLEIWTKEKNKDKKQIDTKTEIHTFGELSTLADELEHEDINVNEHNPWFD